MVFNRSRNNEIALGLTTSNGMGPPGVVLLSSTNLVPGGSFRRGYGTGDFGVVG